MKAENIRQAQDRFYSKKWGIFNHFLYVIQNNPKYPNSYGKQTDWDTLVREFDTETLAKNLHEIGAGYYIITVMQGTKYMIAPNAAFDKIAGTKPGEACSTRDLIEDLYQSLSKYDIDLFLYFTGDGPYKNPEVGEKFGFIEPRDVGVTRPFVENWASVLEEYAVRYGDKVKGWWIDGCYKDWFKYTDELLEIYYNACKKGNPDALVATNGGLREGEMLEGYIHEDFRCGEQNQFDFIPTQRFYGDAQAHILAPLGAGESEIGCWAIFGTKKDGKILAEYVKKVNQAGGVVTIDIGVYRDGKFDEEQMEVLKIVGEKLGTKR